MAPDRRLKAYGDLRDLIFRGFLTYNFDIDNCAFVFKTLNSREFDQINSILNSREGDADYDIRRNIYILAYSVYMLNDVNVLKDRQHYLPKLLKFFRNLPPIMVVKMGENLTVAQDDIK